MTCYTKRLIPANNWPNLTFSNKVIFNISSTRNFVMLNDNLVESNSTITCIPIDFYVHDIKTSTPYNLVVSNSLPLLDFLVPNKCEPLANTNTNNNQVTSNVSVINVSTFQLTPAMTSLLSKGLNFCPTMFMN
jgi:hypothetical protein